MVILLKNSASAFSHPICRDQATRSTARCGARYAFGGVFQQYPVKRDIRLSPDLPHSMASRSEAAGITSYQSFCSLLLLGPHNRFSDTTSTSTGLADTATQRRALQRSRDVKTVWRNAQQLEPHPYKSRLIRFIMPLSEK